MIWQINGQTEDEKKCSVGTVHNLNILQSIFKSVTKSYSILRKLFREHTIALQLQKTRADIIQIDKNFLNKTETTLSTILNQEIISFCLSYSFKCSHLNFVEFNKLFYQICRILLIKAKRSSELNADKHWRICVISI